MQLFEKDLKLVQNYFYNFASDNIVLTGDLSVSMPRLNVLNALGLIALKQLDLSGTTSVSLTDAGMTYFIRKKTENRDYWMKTAVTFFLGLLSGILLTVATLWLTNILQF